MTIADILHTRVTLESMLLGTQLKDGVVMSIVSGSDYPIFMYFCYILKSDSKSAIIYMNKI